jgi:hypothetical protein
MGVLQDIRKSVVTSTAERAGMGDNPANVMGKF